MTKNEYTLSRIEAAKYLTDEGYPYSASTLENYASRGIGPYYVIISGKARYKPEDLIAWGRRGVPENAA